MSLPYGNELDRGGNFAALEQPELFVDELRASCRPPGADRPQTLTP
ncbi:MAG: hypothetical protein JOZ98_20220 [Solirubrobacterales bacterium]|nr:hypothetical protein [Solirubrobacterales bacterium]MBV9425246.1 hypothetical protein [Solirubrobacterales bacterium]MBV9797268.1 hypothetical protein [Solirubrobacterales bacterium]